MSEGEWQRDVTCLPCSFVVEKIAPIGVCLHDAEFEQLIQAEIEDTSANLGELIIQDMGSECFENTMRRNVPNLVSLARHREPP